MNALSHSISEVEEQIRLLESKKFNDEHAGGGWDAVRRFGRSAGQAFVDEGLKTLTFGAGDMADAGTRLRINRKIERGEALTPEEEDALADEMETQQVEARVGDLGNAYTWGQIAGASPWFMAQFLGTGGGFASLGKGLGTRLARKLAERGARRAALEGGESLGMRLAEGDRVVTVARTEHSDDAVTEKPEDEPEETLTEAELAAIQAEENAQAEEQPEDEGEE